MTWSCPSILSKLAWNLVTVSVRNLWSPGTIFVSLDLGWRCEEMWWRPRTHFLMRAMDQERGSHQTLPRSPWFSISLSSLLVASLAVTKEALSGNCFLTAWGTEGGLARVSHLADPPHAQGVRQQVVPVTIDVLLSFCTTKNSR